MIELNIENVTTSWIVSDLYISSCCQHQFFDNPYSESISQVCVSQILPHPYVHYLVSSECLCLHPSASVWWREAGSKGGTGPASNGWGRRRRREGRGGWHHSTAHMAICQFVLSPQPSHLLRTVRMEMDLFKENYHFISFPFRISFLQWVLGWMLSPFSRLPHSLFLQLLLVCT